MNNAHFRIVHKCSTLCVGRLVACGHISQTLYNSLQRNTHIELYTVTYKVCLCVCACTVFPAPFWPVKSVSGVPNWMTAFSPSPAPKLRIPVDEEGAGKGIILIDAHLEELHGRKCSPCLTLY